MQLILTKASCVACLNDQVLCLVLLLYGGLNLFLVYLHPCENLLVVTLPFQRIGHRFLVEMNKSCYGSCTGLGDVLAINQ